ncbi:bacteriophage lambda head decoration protein D [Rhodopseudomonas faecalis]|uniref:Bacteriophage lambda head decoration protein D n=1 Tax=Rhodopseudomonas faecalis TaxID=99655 RepID=A0A318TJI6_9BRAD|nr:head decoration protein [Rhodopseudomonas faecalis]PYF05032.1 bacteriophage lambda head decoration protein D [Rhodopseudomonas faecalis]
MGVLTEGPRKGNFILSEDDEGRLSRDIITVAAGSGKLRPGTVLGMVAASEKYVPSPEAGNDGSQVASACLIDEVDATDHDVETTGIMRHAEVNHHGLYYDASVDTDAKKAAKHAQLKAAGIVVR